MDFTNKPEDKARHDLINPALKEAGWVIQHYKSADPLCAKGVAIEYFEMGKGVGQADYVLFADGEAVGIIEAKKEGETLVGKETQTKRYAEGFPKEFKAVSWPLPFVYESNGNETRFTNLWDPKPASREIFNFHEPETLSEWASHGKETLRKKLTESHSLENKKLWYVQKEAIQNLEYSLAQFKPKALIQMATGSGKTFTAVNICHRLIKNAKAKKILFLVDRHNLGDQTLQEFQNFEVPGDGRKFTELYNVQHLSSNHIEESSKVCISTIQRVYSMLLGKELAPEFEEKSDFEKPFSFEPQPIKYNKKIPIETFDFIIVDECHRSIYNLWRQVLEYFDAFTIGLTATPSKSTIAFFHKNMVMEYTHEQAVADQINVDFTIYNIRTKITRAGAKVKKGSTIQKMDKRTRKKRWQTLEDDLDYDSSKLDREVVSTDQIRTIIRTFKEKVLTEIFPGRKHVPKTLIYAKDDNHAEEIVKTIREEFGEGNDFAVKITYKTEGQKTEDLIRQFRNEFSPRIAVTVDMIATGTDIKPLEIVFFMRSVKSRNYFEQMKGRGVRVMKSDDFMSVTPDATTKERFVIVDAVGLCDIEDLPDTKPLEKMPVVSIEKLIKMLQYGKPNTDVVSTMVSRISRLNKKLSETQLKELQDIAKGKKLKDFARDFVDSIDEDKIYEQAKQEFGKGNDKYEPKQGEIKEITEKRIIASIRPFISNGKLINRILEIKHENEQTIDLISLDKVEEASYSALSSEKAKKVVSSFKEFIKKNQKEISALQLFYSKGKLNWESLKDLSEKIKAPPYSLTPSKLWSAYEQLEKSKVRGRTNNKIADLISVLSFELKKTDDLEPYLDMVDKRFVAWLSKQKSQGVNFTQEQLNWLQLIKTHIATSVEILPEDFEDSPFNQIGGLGKASKVFGTKKLKEILIELNSKVGG